MNAITLSSGRLFSGLSGFLGMAAFVAGCGGSLQKNDEPSIDEKIGSKEGAATSEDGLSQAFATFKQDFIAAGFDQRFSIGFGFHPGLSTEKLSFEGATLNGVAALDFNEKTILGVIVSAPATLKLDLWFVKNVAGSGRTVKPETGDQLLKVGSFQPLSEAGSYLFTAPIGDNVLNFDLDMVVVTRRG